MTGYPGDALGGRGPLSRPEELEETYDAEERRLAHERLLNGYKERIRQDKLAPQRRAEAARKKAVLDERIKDEKVS